MIKRTVAVSGKGYSLASRRRQLRVCRHKEDVGSIPFEDLGVLVLDTPAATITTSALIQASEAGAVTVICGSNHLPVATLQPIAANTLATQRLHAQIELAKPMKSALWARIVRSKILGQAASLPTGSRAVARLTKLAESVSAGDRANREAHASKLYWREVFRREVSGFRRDRFEGTANALLNFGYSVVRASTARAVCAAGLQPALGLQHSNRGNPFCLADDLMEPFRPLVDVAVQSLLREGQDKLSPESKRRLLEVLTKTVAIGGRAGPVSVGIQRVVNSYAGIVVAEARAKEGSGPGARRPPARKRADELQLPWIL